MIKLFATQREQRALRRKNIQDQIETILKRHGEKEGKKAIELLRGLLDKIPADHSCSKVVQKEKNK